MKETYVFRVILDTKDDIFRDIEVYEDQTLEDLHLGILSAFGIVPGEMASFYASDDEWQQGTEVPLMDMGEEFNNLTMSDLTIKNWINEHGKRLLYLYDYMNLWTFFCELLVKNISDGLELLPKTIYIYGIVPKHAPEKDFGSSDDENSHKGLFDDAFDFEEDDDEDDEYGGELESNGYQEW